MMISTIDGERDESELTKRVGADEDDRARIEWVEYWDGERLVHRSAHISVKKGLEFLMEQGTFGG